MRIIAHAVRQDGEASERVVRLARIDVEADRRVHTWRGAQPDFSTFFFSSSVTSNSPDR